MDGDHEVDTRGDGTEPCNKDSNNDKRHLSVRVHARIRSVEGPAGIDSTEQHARQDQRAAGHVHVPAA